jgi:hypothetical protein
MHVKVVLFGLFTATWCMKDIIKLEVEKTGSKAVEGENISHQNIHFKPNINLPLFVKIIGRPIFKFHSTV